MSVFVFTTDIETLSVVASDLESSRIQGLLNSADDIEDILGSYSSVFSIYGMVNISANNATFSQESKVTQEGVYYTAFVAAPANRTKNNNVSVYSELEDANEVVKQGDSYVTVSGEITMTNTFGYLNAEQYPLLSFYIWITCAYLLGAAVWAFLCLKHRSQLIELHHFLSWILGCQIVQGVFMIIEYEV